MEQYAPQPNNNESSFQEKECPLEVQEYIEKIKLDFKSEFGENIEDYFSGDIEKSCKVHKFIFDKTIKELDPEKRKIINLSHLKFEAENHLNTEIISPHGDKIGNAGKLISEIFTTDFSYNQMLANGQKIIKGSDNKKLRIDNNEIIEVFQNFSEDFLKATKILGKKYPAVDSKVIEKEALMMAVQKQLDDYFGETNRNTGDNNTEMYEEEETRNLHDFKGQSNATCTELSMLAQQLISFAGVKSKFMSGGPLEKTNEDVSDSAPFGITHAFNIIYLDKESDESAYLYDPANPMFVKNESDQSRITKRRYIAPLTKEQLQIINTRGAVDIIHEGTDRVYWATRY